MEMIYATLKLDLGMILVCYAVLLLAFASNVVLSLYYNISMSKEKFDKKRLLLGIKKAVVLVVGTLLLAIAIDAATLLLADYVPDIGSQTHDIIKVVMIATTIGVAAWRYIKDAYNTFINILNGKPTENADALDNKE